MYVYATGDQFLGRKAADLTAHYVAADYRYEELEGRSHWLPEEAPEDVAKLVTEAAEDFAKLLIEHARAHWLPTIGQRCDAASGKPSGGTRSASRASTPTGSC